MTGGRRAVAAAWVALLALVAGCAHDAQIDPPSPSAPSAGHGTLAEQQRLLTSLAARLQAYDADGASRLGTGKGAALLRQAAANARTLGLTDISLRVVDEDAGAGTSTVDLRYRLPQWDEGPTQVETTLRLAEEGDELRIAGVGDTGRRPLWITGEVGARAHGRVLVIARDDRFGRYPALAEHAVVDVQRVLPDWRGRLVIEVPGSADELHAVLGAEPGQYANIAAVTASVDGSLAPDSPVHVFMNPEVFDKLGPNGAQVVLSHESTHVATGATLAEVPTWLLEGFADYVALVHAGIPVRRAASQALARYRKDGPPKELPTQSDLDPQAPGLGATYEEAWLATHFIAARHGQRRLVAFYRAVSDGTPVADAFRRILGTTQEQFVKEWSADCARLAGVRAGSGV